MSSASTISSGNQGGKSFLFDQAFPPETKQKYIFEKSIKPLVEACLKGYNATVLAYGQTGSGKTFTILGSSPNSILSDDDVNANANANANANSSSSIEAHQAGIIPRALRDLFNRLETTRKKHLLAQDDEKPFEYEVRVQFLELYGEDINDLLTNTNNNSGTKLVIRDGGGGVEPEVIGASEVKVNSAEEALLCLTRGTLRRVTGATAMNSESSRSHAIMTVIVEQTTVVRLGSGSGNSTGSAEKGHGNGESEKDKGSGGNRSVSSVKSSGSGSGSGNVEIESKRSKFHFVDLAGSERQKRSLAQGQRLKEGIDINKGLLVLGNVISALGDPKKKGKSFVPYRDSKLTRLLKGSLGGNHKTLMIACVSPSSINLEETLNCLRYANRAKNIQNNAIINLDAGSKLVADLRMQVQALAGELVLVQGQSGNDSSRRFALDTLKMLAKGADSTNVKIAPGFGLKRTRSTDSLGSQNTRYGNGNSADEDMMKDFKAEIAKLKSANKQLKGDLATKSEELFAAKAESEYYRLQINDEDDDPSGEEGKDVFVNRVQEYEGEIESLKKQLRNVKANSAHSAFRPLTPSSSPLRRALVQDDAPSTPNSGYSKRNRAKTFRAIVIPDEEEKEESKEMKNITKKYLKVGTKDCSVVEEEDEEDAEDLKYVVESEEDEDETFMSRQSILSSHMLELTKGIAAKQELIGKLERSQLKYEVSYWNILQMLAFVFATKETSDSPLLSFKENEIFLSRQAQENDDAIRCTGSRKG